MSAVLTSTAIPIENAAYLGFPSPVRQADRVCVQERVTALTANTRTSRTSTSDSEGASARKIMRTAGRAKKYSPSAQGMLAASVTSRA